MQLLEDNAHFLFVVLAGGLLALLMFRLRVRREHSLNLGQRSLLATNLGYFTTLYTFFLSFAVISLWQTYNDADTTLTHETDLLVVEYRLSHSLQSTEVLRRLLQEYVSVVVQDEWPEMRRGRVSSSAAEIYERIWREVSRIKPQNMEDHFVYSVMLNNMVELNKLRHSRLLQVNGNLYFPLWVILYLGVGFTIVGFYFSNLQETISDAVYITTILTMLYANIFLVIELDRPFGGALALGPQRFAEALKSMQAISATLM